LAVLIPLRVLLNFRIAYAPPPLGDIKGLSNIRGLNSNAKWNTIRSKIHETSCDIVCLQETKREDFDSLYIKNFCHSTFDRYKFVPSLRGFRGNLNNLESSKFSGQMVFQNRFALSLELRSVISGSSWILTNV
jgi:mRNA deadenylase 3'-5' endonuclease subunit Ccr4